MARRTGGFTLVEILIVLVVLGVLSAIAIPNLLNALQRGRQKRTMEDMRALGTAVASYAIDRDAMVEQSPAGPVAQISASLAPTYVQSPPERDAWQTDFVYEGAERSYTLTSYGKDRQAGGGGAVGEGGTTTDFDADIVFADGTFVQLPDGVQR